MLESQTRQMARNHPGRFVHSLAMGLTFVLLSLLSGCGENWQADVYPAKGKVTVNGKAPTGALVQLIPSGTSKPDERNSRPWGLVVEDGTYTLSTYNGEPGAPPGEYMFTMTWPPDASLPSFDDRLKGRYSRPDQSAWKITLKPETNEIPTVVIDGAEVDMKLGQKQKSEAKASANVKTKAFETGPMNIEPPIKKSKGKR